MKNQRKTKIEQDFRFVRTKSIVGRSDFRAFDTRLQQTYDLVIRQKEQQEEEEAKLLEQMSAGE